MIYAHYKTNDHLVHLNAMTYEARHHPDSFKARPLVLTLLRLLSHKPSGLHGLNLLTGKLNRYILYKSPQTRKPQVAVSQNPKHPAYSGAEIFMLQTQN